MDFIVSERCVFVALIITGDFLLEGFLGEPSNMEKFVDSSFAKKRGKRRTQYGRSSMLEQKIFADGYRKTRDRRSIGFSPS